MSYSKEQREDIYRTAVNLLVPTLLNQISMFSQTMRMLNEAETLEEIREIPNKVGSEKERQDLTVLIAGLTLIDRPLKECLKRAEAEKVLKEAERHANTEDES